MSGISHIVQIRKIFDRSLVEAVQGIALSRDNRLPFAQIWIILSLFRHVFILRQV